ncbi:M48 family metallopeptidase [Catenulispora subtropica]|uniref:Peptidase M48 domain-containing protein n=1 Tax=Catenulispora subtropica TaxID=450798 RepID=A0ABP5D7X7_9ACTN
MPGDHGLIGPEELKRLDAEKRLARRRREAGRRRAETLERRLAQAEDLRPGGLARLSALLFGIGVHALTVAVLVGSVLLLFDGVWVLWIVALLGFGVVWQLRPRLGRKPGAGWQRREDLPRLFAVLDRVGGAIGAPTPSAVRVDTGFNASTQRLGLRHEPVLTLGAPLWQVLEHDERLALLGHELGHHVNGDAARGVLVATARHSLREWRVLLYPSSGGTRAMSGPAGLAQLLVPVVLFPFYILMTSLDLLYGWIQVHVSLRAEFLADEIAARTASTDSAVRLISKLDVHMTVASHLARVKAARKASRKPVPLEEGAAFWDGLRDYVATIPEHEYARQERVSVFRGTRVDASHPAHYLRRRLLKERPHYEATVTVSDEEWEAVDRELNPFIVEAGHRLIR